MLGVGRSPFPSKSLALRGFFHFLKALGANPPRKSRGWQANPSVAGKKTERQHVYPLHMFTLKRCLFELAVMAMLLCGRPIAGGLHFSMAGLLDFAGIALAVGAWAVVAVALIEVRLCNRTLRWLLRCMWCLAFLVWLDRLM